MRRLRVSKTVSCPRTKTGKRMTTRPLYGCELCRHHKGIEGDCVLCDYPKKDKLERKKYADKW